MRLGHTGETKMRLTRIMSTAFFLALGALQVHAQVVIAPADRQPVRIQGRQNAPEFEDIEEWLNSKPMAMRDLRGKVVVIHFMAFG